MRRLTTPVVLLALCGAVCSVLTACAPARARPPAEGRIVAVTPVDRLDRAAVADRLAELGLPTDHVTTGIRADRVGYRTTDPDGAATTASTLVVRPDPAPPTARLVSWHHGTTVGRDEVASMTDGEDRGIAFALAATGAVVSAPDYLGLGEGPGSHPYLDHASAAATSLDALRAVRELPDLPRLDPAVRVGGFSQGGPVSLALGRTLQQERPDGLGLGAVVSVGGPFDVSGTLHRAATQGIANVSGYLTYLTLAWARPRGLWQDPTEVLREPYATTVPPLFDGHHPAREVLAALPAPAELFTDGWAARMRDPDPAFAAALAAEDATCDWTPTVPVRLYFGAADADVPTDNADYCRARLGEAADVGVVDVGPVDHGGSVGAALPAILVDLG